MTGLIEDWNKGLAEATNAAEEHNCSILAQVQDGQLSAEEALSRVLPRPRKLAPPSRHWAANFLRQWGWSMLSRSSDAQIALPYDHEDMQQSRLAYRDLLERQGVHKGLVLNFDQLWRTAWASSAKLLFKSGAAGEKSCRVKATGRANKKLDTVKHGRRGITALTSSWSDGSPGPICFCLPEGRLTAEEMKQWNDAHVGESYVMSSGSKTHFMTADCLLQVYDQVYSPALAKQRAK